MESGLNGDQRVAIVDCIENYIGDWACPDPYGAADFIAARVLEITRAPSDAALVEALEAVRDYRISANPTAPDAHHDLVLLQHVGRLRTIAIVALAAAKGQP